MLRLAGRIDVSERQVNATPDERPGGLGQLLDVLGEPVLRLLAAPHGMAVPVTEAVVYDQYAPLPSAPGGLLLAVGVEPRSPAARRLVRDAAAGGLTAVAVKTYDMSTSALAAEAESCGVALLVLDGEVSWHQAHLLIASTLSAQQAGPRSADGPALGDLFALANAIAAAVGGATAIEDLQQRVLAYSTLPEQRVDEERRQGILGRQVPDVAENAAQYRDVFYRNDVCRLPAVRSGLPRLAVAVRAGAEALGSIWVVDGGALASNAEEALAQGAAMAALHLLRARATEELARRQHGDLLRRVLDGGESAGVIAPQLGLAEDEPVRVAAFTLAGDASPLAVERAALRLVDLVGLQCEARYGRHACVLSGRTVYALLPAAAEAAERKHKRLATEIANRASTSLRLPVLAGLGGVVPGLREAGSSRDEADWVLRVLIDTTEPEHRPAATAAEVRAKITLLRLSDLLATESTLRQGTWQRLLDHDGAQGTEHARTVLAYVESCCDIASTARALAVHPNTCRYRLRQMQHQLAFDLADPDERLVLWLQLRTATRRPI